MLCKNEHVAIDVRFKFERVSSGRSPLIRVEIEPAEREREREGERERVFAFARLAAAR